MKNKYVRAIGCGILASLGFAPTYLFFIFFVSFDFLLSVIKAESNSIKHCWKVGYCFGFGYFLGNCYWLVSPLTFEFPKYIALIPLAIIVVPAILGLYVAVISSCLKYLILKYKLQDNFLIALLFAILWGFMELVRSYFFIGFPWNLIAYSWGFHRTMFQIVSIIGTFGLCFVVAFVYTMYFTVKQNKQYCWIYCLIFITIFTIGLIRLNQEKHDNTKLNLKVRVVQPNFLQQEKQDKNKTNQQLKYIETVINDTMVNDEKIQLVIFPETTMPHYVVDENSYTIKTIMTNMNFRQQKILTGVVRYDYENFYNSLIIFNGNKIINYYDKYYLAPFGEYIPYSYLLPKFITAFVGTGFSQGKERAKILDNAVDGLKIAPIICYESLFPTAINKNTDLIINITNDIWFGKTSAVYQHFTALKFRAVENNVPAIRSANSGISAYINRYGKVIKKTKLNTVEIFDVEL